MRWVAPLTVALLLASVQCLSACALASCEQVSAAHTPPAAPCHRHPKAPAPHAGNPCDHQQAVSSAASDAQLPDMALLPVVNPAPPMVARVALPGTPRVLESPPGPVVSSVLRI